MSSARVLKILSRPLLEEYIILAIENGFLDHDQRIKIAQRIDHKKPGKSREEALSCRYLLSALLGMRTDPTFPTELD